MEGESIDVKALDLQIPRKRSIQEQLAQLLNECDSLAQSNAELKQAYENAVQSNSIMRGIHQFKRRLVIRDKIVKELGDPLSKELRSPDPNFVEVQKNKDMVSTSLLISNGQRQFFNISEIRQQNMELEALIEEEMHQLDFTNARLKPYEEKKRFISMMFDGMFPSNIQEQEDKIAMMKDELSSLMGERTKIQFKMAEEKRERNMSIKRKKAAVTIQSTVRMFLARRRMKAMIAAAMTIQNAWRNHQSALHVSAVPLLCVQ